MVTDDVWESDGEEDRENGLDVRTASDLDREWQARQTQFHTLGYRDGIEAGKNSSVQEGFNGGYREAILAGCDWGRARGITSAFAAFPPSLKEFLLKENSAVARLDALHKTVSALSSGEALRSYYRHSILPGAPRPVVPASAQRSLTSEEDEIVPEDVPFATPSVSTSSASSLSIPGVDRLPEMYGGSDIRVGESDGLDNFPRTNSEHQIQGTVNLINRPSLPVMGLIDSAATDSEAQRADGNALACSAQGCACTTSISENVDQTSCDEASNERTDWAAGEGDIDSERLRSEVLEELAPLTVPSTPITSELIDLQRKVCAELELACIKLSYIAPSP